MDYYIQTNGNITTDVNGNEYYSTYPGNILGYPVEFKESPEYKIKKVEFHNNLATVVYWKDGTVTRVKIKEGDEFNAEFGLAMAVAKKVYGSYENFQKSLAKAKFYANGKKLPKKTLDKKK